MFGYMVCCGKNLQIAAYMYSLYRSEGMIKGETNVPAEDFIGAA
ncbi:hypothetical protein [Peribacillus sp. SCS-155]